MTSFIKYIQCSFLSNVQFLQGRTSVLTGKRNTASTFMLLEHIQKYSSWWWWSLSFKHYFKLGCLKTVQLSWRSWELLFNRIIHLSIENRNVLFTILIGIYLTLTVLKTGYYLLWFYNIKFQTYSNNPTIRVNEIPLSSHIDSHWLVNLDLTLDLSD